jgi:hypothetical protein
LGEEGKGEEGRKQVESLGERREHFSRDIRGDGVYSKNFP